ncbi:MAG: hypothetical protein ABIN96_04725 [Rubrivivax sp.]
MFEGVTGHCLRIRKNLWLRICSTAGRVLTQENGMTTLQSIPFQSLAGVRPQPQAKTIRPLHVKVQIPAPAPVRSWIERLAAWSDRQPPHRRLGNWTVF